jgi:nucleoside-diphosphate-sugar epimerase
MRARGDEAMTIALVTGATGFVGSHLVRRLVRDGYAVHVLCRASSDPWRIRDVLADIHIHTPSLLDTEEIRQVVEAIRPDYIFHLAAAPVIAGVTASEADVVAFNFLGTVNLIDACEGVDYLSLVTTGDAFEYGPSAALMSEADVCRPDTPHGITKLQATFHAQASARARGRPIVILRPFSIYGPDDHPRRLVPRVIAGALRGTPIALSRPDSARDWLYVEDLVELYLEASRKPEMAGGVFNAGSGRQVTLAELVEAVCRLTGSSVEVQWDAVPAAAHDTDHGVADMRCTLQAFAWRPRTSLDDGLRKTIVAMAGRASDRAGSARPCPSTS